MRVRRHAGVAWCNSVPSPFAFVLNTLHALLLTGLAFLMQCSHAYLQCSPVHSQEMATYVRVFNQFAKAAIVTLITWWLLRAYTTKAPRPSPPPRVCELTRRSSSTTPAWEHRSHFSVGHFVFIFLLSMAVGVHRDVAARRVDSVLGE